MIAYAIVTRQDPEPQPHDFNHNDNYDDWKAKKAEAAWMIRLSCSHEERRIVKGIRNLHVMCSPLETSLDTAGSYIGRQDILRRFRVCRPKEDEPLKAYFTKFSNYCIPLVHRVSNGSGLPGFGPSWNRPEGPGLGQEPPSNPTRVTSSQLLPGPDINPRFSGRVVPGLRFHITVPATLPPIKYMSCDRIMT